MMKAGLSLCVCAVLVAAGYPLVAGEKGAFDPAKLEGKWNYVSGEKSGAKVDADTLKKQHISIAKGVWTLKGDEATFVMKTKIDAKKSPAGIQIEITESPFGAGMKANGIIELKGDDLKLCYNADGGDAPKAFATKDGDKNHYFVLKRAK